MEVEVTPPMNGTAGQEGETVGRLSAASGEVEVISLAPSALISAANGVGWLRPFPGGDSLTLKSLLAAGQDEQLFLAPLPAVLAGRSRKALALPIRSIKGLGIHLLLMP